MEAPEQLFPDKAWKIKLEIRGLCITAKLSQQSKVNL